MLLELREIGFIVLDKAHVIQGHKLVHSFFGIKFGYGQQLRGNGVLGPYSNRGICDAHIRGAYCQNSLHISSSGAALEDVPHEETTLRKSYPDKPIL